MDSFVIHNIQGSEDEVSENGNLEPHNQTTSEDKEGDSAPENSTDNEDVTCRKNETNNVPIPYCIFNLGYTNHSYILKGRVVAFAEKEKDKESEIFQVEEIEDQEEYRNWVPKSKGRLPVPPKSDFICSPVEVSKHRKVKLRSKPIEKDTAQRFDKLCDHFPEVFLKKQ